jgi:ATP-dependent DNA helicase RecQ
LVEARRGQSGIVYALSRKACESLADHLRRRGLRAGAYHAGLEPAVRNAVQDAFSRDEIDVVVATIAFGMGIDKSNVRYVIHRDMPKSIESYYQEIGRAGRDGLPSDCVLFYSWADVLAYDRFGDDVDPAVAARQREQAREMFRLAESRDCRHRTVVRHLGEAVSACGGSCDTCTGRDVLGDSGPLDRTPTRGTVAAAPSELGSDDGEIFARLKALRTRLATARAVPAYVVFSDATLIAIASRRPRSPEALLAISGIGPKKLELYGEDLLAVIAGHQPASIAPI